MTQRRSTAAERQLNIRWTYALTQITMCTLGPWLIWTREDNMHQAMIGTAMVLVGMLMSVIVRRIIIVWLSCMGLYALRWLICRAVTFPQGPGRIDDPDAPWRVWLGVKE